MRSSLTLRRGLIGLGLVACLLALSHAALARSPWPSLVASQTSQSVAVDDLVVVTEDLALNQAPGCDAVSVFAAASGQALYHGERIVSPGRLAGNADLSLVIANHSNTAQADTGGPFLFALRGDPTDLGRWFAQGRFGGVRFPPRSGLALLPDGDTLLASVAGPSSTGSDLRPPFELRKFRWSEVSAGRIGAGRGQFAIDGPAVEIFSTAGGSLAHVVTENATVYTLEVAGMTQVAAPIALPPFDREPPSSPGQQLNIAQAGITPGGRFLVTNRWRVPELSVADLVARRAFTLPLGADLVNVGGLAVNHAALNHGLLAVHAGDAVLTYRFEPDRGLIERLGRAAVRPLPIYPGAEWGPAPSIAWSGDGRRIIAATSEGTAEFRVFEVGQAGASLSPGALLSACPDGTNRPNDILTTNLRAVPPTPPSPTTIPTVTETPTVTPTPIHSPTPSDTPTVTPTPTITPTPSDQLVHLPLILREVICRPERLSVDVVLVIDASNSMANTTATGRTKLDAARDASRQFVDRLIRAGQNQIAIVAFNSGATLIQSLTIDRGALQRGLEAIRLAEQTCIGCGITTGRLELSSPRRRAANAPVMIVLTDGRPNGESSDATLAAAAAAQEAGIRVFAIGLGTDVDFSLLSRIASQRDYFYQAPDGEQLALIYQDIVEEIPCPPDSYWGGR